MADKGWRQTMEAVIPWHTVDRHWTEFIKITRKIKKNTLKKRTQNYVWWKFVRMGLIEFFIGDNDEWHLIIFMILNKREKRDKVCLLTRKSIEMDSYVISVGHTFHILKKETQTFPKNYLKYMYMNWKNTVYKDHRFYWFPLRQSQQFLLLLLKTTRASYPARASHLRKWRYPIPSLVFMQTHWFSLQHFV